MFMQAEFPWERKLASVSQKRHVRKLISFSHLKIKHQRVGKFPDRMQVMSKILGNQRQGYASFSPGLTALAQMT
jgi:hypothetical protein